MAQLKKFLSANRNSDVKVKLLVIQDSDDQMRQTDLRNAEQHQ